MDLARVQPWLRCTRQAAFVLATCALVSCSARMLPASTPTQNAAVLRLMTSTAVFPLVQEITRAYTRFTEGEVIFDIATGNAGAMFERLTAGEAPYLISAHLAQDVGQSPDVWAAPLAQDGIAVIVHPDNPVRGLTSAQLREVFQGRVGSWASLGGVHAPVVVFSREAGSDTRDSFEGMVMGTRPTSPAARIAPSSEAMIYAVSQDINAIGYVSMGWLGDSVRVLTVDNVALTPESVSSNAYPLRTLVVVTGLREPDGSAPLDMAWRAFFGWIQSPQGQEVVARRYGALAN
jgi:phosphate transport system substrate-binding protein